MAAYRDDLEAAVRRATALEAELHHLRSKRREDRAELRVALVELREDLDRERARLRKLEAMIDLIGDSGTSEEALAAVSERLKESDERLHEVHSDLRRLKKRESLFKPNKRSRKTMLIAGGAWAASVLLTLVTWTAVSTNWSTVDTDGLDELLLSASYQVSVGAVQRFDQAVADNPDDARLLASAARAHAILALEFYTEHDERALELVRRAAEAGASEEDLVSARVMVALARWEMERADRLLNETVSGTSDRAVELIYLRGVWYLRLENPRAALRRFRAARQAEPNDMRPRIGLAQALHASGSASEALAILDDVNVSGITPNRGDILRARIDLERGHLRVRDSGNPLFVGSSMLSRDAHAWGLWLVARSELAEGEPDDALSTLWSASRERPERDVELAACLAQLFLELGYPTAAHREASEAVRTAPTVERFKLLQVEALLDADRLPEAFELMRGLRHGPRHSLLLGRLYMRSRSHGMAETLLSEAMQNDEVATEAAVELARLFLDTGRAEDARRLLESLTAVETARPETLALLAEVQRRALRFDHARQTQRTALTLSENHPDVLETSGELHLELGDLVAARLAFDRAHRQRPRSWRSLRGLARVAIARRDFAQAETHLDRMRRIAPAGWTAFVRGELLLRQYEPQAALPFLEQAADALPRCAVVQTRLGDANVLLTSNRGALRQARHAYRQALRDRPGYPEALVGRAEVSLLGTNMRRTERHLAEANEALERTPHATALQARLRALEGQMHYEYQAELADAREDLNEALGLDSNLATAHLILALVEEDAGDRRSACRSNRAFLALAGRMDTIDVGAARSYVRENCTASRP